MFYLVDGYNVVRRVERLRTAEQTRGLEAGREALLDAIRGSSLLKKSRVEVIFDGTAEGMPSIPSLHPNVGVRFSVAPQNADGAILEILRSLADPETRVVVTADRDLAWEARKLGASILSPEAWLKALCPPERRPVRSAADSTKPHPTRADIQWGLATFGDEVVEVLPERKKARAPSAPEPARNRSEMNAIKLIKERHRARHLSRTRRG